MRNLSLTASMSCLLAITLPAGAAFLPGKTGEQTRYKLTYKGDGTTSVRGMLAGENAPADRIQTDLDAQLEVVQITPSLLAVRLISPAHRLQINGQVRDLKCEIATLEHPCYITADAAGRVQSVSFASGTPAPARSLMRTLVSGLEFAGTNASAQAWQIEQDTINGPAQTAYRKVNGFTVEKRIIDYPLHRSIGPKGMPQMRPTTDGSLRYTLHQGNIEAIHGEFSTRFTLANRKLSQGQELFDLSRVSSEMEPAAALRLLHANYDAQCAAEAPTALHVHDKDPTAERASWVTLVKGATPDSLLADLAAADAKGATNDSGLFSRLYAEMTLQPATCSGFEQMLQNAQPKMLSTRLVIAALAAVSAGERPQSGILSISMAAAQQALYGVLAAHKYQADMVVLVAPAIGMVSSPSQKTEALLESLTNSSDRDIAISCALALGSLAHNGSAGLSKKAVGYLERKLAIANASNRQQLLAALGNAGSADSLNLLAGYAKSASSQLRSVAMMSIRLVPGDRATELLYRGLRDADPDVRLNAARAFQFRPFSTSDVHEFTGLITTEKIDRVRKELLSNLKAEVAYYPQAQTVLAVAATRDTSSDIRNTVAGWLK